MEVFIIKLNIDNKFNRLIVKVFVLMIMIVFLINIFGTDSSFDIGKTVIGKPFYDSGAIEIEKKVELSIEDLSEKNEMIKTVNYIVLKLDNFLNDSLIFKNLREFINKKLDISSNSKF